MDSNLTEGTKTWFFPHFTLLERNEKIVKDIRLKEIYGIQIKQHDREQEKKRYIGDVKIEHVLQFNFTGNTCTFVYFSKHCLLYMILFK